MTRMLRIVDAKGMYKRSVPSPRIDLDYMRGQIIPFRLTNQLNIFVNLVKRVFRSTKFVVLLLLVL